MIRFIRQPWPCRRGDFPRHAEPLRITSAGCPAAKISARFACAIFAGLLGMCQAVYGQLPTTQLTGVVPPGGQQGTKLEVRTAGADQDDAVQLLFSHPGIKAQVRTVAGGAFRKDRPQPGVFDVEISKDVPTGTYEARVVGRFGVSNPRAFVVGPYAEIKEPGGNAQLASAPDVAVNTTINGACDANQIDHYKVSLRAGQRVLFDCAAARIDSRLSPALVLYDANGQEVARVRDSVQGDAMLELKPERDGEFRVAVYDFTYRGGADYFYRLTIHSGPHIDFIFPPSGVPGSSDDFAVYGRNLPDGKPAAGVVIQQTPLDVQSVAIPLPADPALATDLKVAGFMPASSALLDGFAYRLGTSNPVDIPFALAPVVKESEPNSDANHAQAVTFPCEIAGQFYPARDVDYFEWQAKKGEVYDIEVFSHRLALPTDPAIVLWKVTKNDKGEVTLKEVAQADDPSDRNNRINTEFDTSTDDPSYRLTADADATYRVMIWDQFGDSRDDPRMLYRLAIHRGQPDFRMLAIPQPVVSPANANAVALGGVSVRRGGCSHIEVRLDRRYGFAGDVEVSVEGLPAGTICSPVVIGAGTSVGWLVVTATEDAAGWAGTLRIVGKAKVGDQEVVRSARAGTAVWNAANRTQEKVTFRVTRDLAFAVIDREKQPAVVQAGEDKIFETSRGGKLTIPIKVVRRDGFKEDLALTPANAPNELKPPNLTIKGADAEGQLELAATNGNLKPGLYTFNLRADTKVSHVRNPDAIAAAEQEQKDVDAAIAKLTEGVKQATAAKAAAPAKVQEAMQAVKQGEQEVAAAAAAAKGKADAIQVVAEALEAVRAAAAKDSAKKPLADAVTILEKAKAEAEAAKVAADQTVAAAKQKQVQLAEAVKAAEQAIAAAGKTVADTEAQLQAAQQAKTEIDKRLTEVKNANKAKDVTFAVISTPIRVRVAETCLELQVGTPSGPIKAGQKLEVPVTVKRLYGYDDAVEVTVEVPGDAKGLSAPKITLAKGQAEGKLELTAAADAPAAPRNVTVRAKGRFNNIEVTAAQPLAVQVGG